MARVRVGVLISGRGSNLQALIDAANSADYPAEIALVISNEPDAGGLKRAAAAGIDTKTFSHKGYPDRESFETALTAAFEEARCELICNAGFMRVLTSGFVDRWHNRQLNIHPSLLPAFPGLDTHARALASGVKLHGCTVHFVRAKVDAGPIIGQAAVPVLADDDEATLAARVLEAEHRLYPLCLALVARGKAKLGNHIVKLDAGAEEKTVVLMNPRL